MYKLIAVIFGTFFVASLCIISCKKDSVDYAGSAYPPAVAQIVLNRCAIPGCHNNASYANSSGLNLTTWTSLFNGGYIGADVIPYDTAQSSFYTFLSLRAGNIMPAVGNRLSNDEVATIAKWILNGAPNAKGEVAFSGNPNRHKVYVCNQGCDKITVFDAATGIAMRYIGIGANPNEIETAHCIRMTADKQHLVVVFRSSQYMEVYSTVTDAFEYRIDLNPGGASNPYQHSWDIVVVSPDGTKAIASSLTNGLLAFADLTTHQLVSYSASVPQAHGMAANADFTRLYVTSQTGNYVSRFNLNPTSDAAMAALLTTCTKIPLTNDTSVLPIDNHSVYDPHEIIFSPDYTKYFVSCQASNEIRVMNAANDSLIAIIPVGTFPQDFSLSHNQPLLFCTCMQDNYGIDKCIGAVAAINYNTLALVKLIRGSSTQTVTNPYQPHGVVVDDIDNKVYISNLNYSSTGPAPHHVSVCGRDGFVTAIDLNTLNWVPLYHPEVSSFPYSTAIR